MCVLFTLKRLFENFSFRDDFCEILQKRLHVKHQSFLSDFNKTRICRQMSEKAQVSSFIEICQVEDELFHAERRTDKRTDRQTDRQTDRPNVSNSRFPQF